ncbi:MAG: hypothetical protein QOJ96_1147 [Alphaproteobacteria bacterium]|nr:hypothetical protein [Alphaproteobacteria bacterium]
MNLANAPQALLLAARATPVSLFSVPSKGKWSAGRRQGACEAPLAGLAIGPPERLRGVPLPSDVGERRLPALHFPAPHEAGPDLSRCEASHDERVSASKVIGI